MEIINIVYWHWMVLGLVLIIAELLVPSFTILWFGLGAFVVCLVLLFFPEIILTWQILIWAISSAVLTFFWFKLFKIWMIDRTKAGITREAVMGESGTVIKVPSGNSHGTVRFSMPLMGSDEWPFIVEQNVELGDRVFIKDVSGNTLIVEKRTK